MYTFVKILIVAFLSLTVLHAQGGAKAANAKGNAAAAKNKKKPEDKTEKGDALDSAKDLADPVKKQQLGWSPEFGVVGTAGMPFGDAGQVLNLGFGGRADFNTHIPALKFFKQHSFDIRPGFFGGVMLHSVKSDTKTGKFTALPGVLYAQLELTKVRADLRPYFAVGSGVTMSSASSTVTSTGESKSVSSVDATIYVALGMKYFLGKDQKFFIRADVSFYMIFEEVSGMFIHANVGGGYRL